MVVMIGALCCVGGYSGFRPLDFQLCCVRCVSVACVDCLGLVLVGFTDCLGWFDLVVAYVDFRLLFAWCVCLLR